MSSFRMIFLFKSYIKTLLSLLLVWSVVVSGLLDGLFGFLGQVVSDLKVHQMFQRSFLKTFFILLHLPIEVPSPNCYRSPYCPVLLTKAWPISSVFFLCFFLKSNIREIINTAIGAFSRLVAMITVFPLIRNEQC